MATKGAERWSTGISLPNGLTGAMQGVGGLFAMGADAIKFTFRRPFQAREFLEQSWFIARVALAPTFLVAIPFTVLISFILNILLRELGAADLSGAGAAFGAVTQVGPLVTVLIVAGAGATAMCADLGSRTIREEIDAMEVLGINPVQRLVTPRMLAAGYRQPAIARHQAGDNAEQRRLDAGDDHFGYPGQQGDPRGECAGVDVLDEDREHVAADDSDDDDQAVEQ